MKWQAIWDLFQNNLGSTGVGWKINKIRLAVVGKYWIWVMGQWEFTICHPSLSIFLIIYLRQIFMKHYWLLLHTINSNILDLVCLFLKIWWWCSKLMLRLTNVPESAFGYAQRAGGHKGEKGWPNKVKGQKSLSSLHGRGGIYVFDNSRERDLSSRMTGSGASGEWWGGMSEP